MPVVVPVPAVSAAIFREGKVLLAQRGKPPLTGIWSLPGGHIEPGEKALVAIARELAEETGIEADLLGVTDVADVILRHDDGTLMAHYVITAFYGLWLAGEAKAMSDCQAVDWVDPYDVSDRQMTVGTPAIIARAAALAASDTTVSQK